MFRRLMLGGLALCLLVGLVTQIGEAQEPKTLEQRVEALEAKVEALTDLVKELNQRIEKLFLTEVLDDIADKAKIGAAKAELAVVKNGLGMYQAEDDFSSYPSSSMITSFNDLRKILSPYTSMPNEREAAFTFVSYASAKRDTFVLTAKARDTERTVIAVTPVIITIVP